MQRLSLADLKAKAAAKAVSNSEVFTGGAADDCHCPDPGCVVIKVIDCNKR